MLSYGSTSFTPFLLHPERSQLGLSHVTRALGLPACVDLILGEKEAFSRPEDDKFAEHPDFHRSLPKPSSSHPNVPRRSHFFQCFLSHKESSRGECKSVTERLSLITISCFCPGRVLEDHRTAKIFSYVTYYFSSMSYFSTHHPSVFKV